MFGFEEPELLAVGVHAWGVLRQDSMRATLEQGSEALHRRLREILGLSPLAEFEVAARDAASGLSKEAEMARSELDRIIAQLSTAKRELESAEENDSTRNAARLAATAEIDRLRTSVVGGVRVTLPTKVSSDDLSSLGVEIGVLIREALEITQQLAASPLVSDVPSPEAVQELRSRYEIAVEEHKQLETRQSAEVRLAEAALKLLSDHCPVCAQSINEDSVRDRLDQKLTSDAEAVTALEQARAVAVRAAAALEDAEGRLRGGEAVVSGRRHAADRWAGAISSAEHLMVPAGWQNLDDIGDALDALQEVRDQLQVAYRVVVALESDPAVASKRARVDELQSAAGNARERAADISSRQVQAEALRRAAVESSVEITEQSLKALEPAFAEVYDRLAPHPSFTTLRMFHDVYYGKGRSTPRIFDPIRDIEANPNLVCSEGQLNIIALSYFLALNLETDPGGLPFAILDDPLQAMDVINVLGFCDIARELRHRRQLLLTTHDRRFAAVLERKLGPRSREQRTLLLRFSSWDREGPRVEAMRPELEQIPSLLKLVA
jgi:hypothetical protein